MPKYQSQFRSHDCMADDFVDNESNFHTDEDYLCFTGYDMTAPWRSFDTEIEFWSGSFYRHHPVTYILLNHFH